jgi:hypothetical protein
VAREEDFLFAERALQRGYVTDEQVQECLSLLERLREEMKIDETLPNLMVKKGYLAAAQANVLDAEIHKDRTDRPKNAIEGYRLLERIGAGAMGSVYRADHLKLQVPVALKVLNPSLSSSRTQIERLKREAQLAARLSHPNVVRSLDVGESNGFHYLAMEFVEGRSVRDRIQEGRIPEKEALAIVRQVASGLAHAHARGVVHRDVKPGNILITPDGVVKLADFGLARGQGPSDLTLEHASIGTPQYVAPEQMRRGSDATARSDLFSLGATLYHMVTGRPPFDGANLGEIVQNVLACRFEPPERLAPELSRDAIYVIDRLMRANPRERYANAQDLVADLERIERGEPIAPPDFLGDYHSFLAKRRGRRNAILAAAAAVLVALGAFLIVRARNQARERELLAFCDARNTTRATDIDTLAAGSDLAAAIRGMEEADAEAASSGCPEATVAALRARLRAARADASALSAAERALAVAGVQRTADYRELDRRIAAQAPAFEGVRRRIAKLREDLKAASDAAAEARYARDCTNGFVDLEAAKREAKAFATDLESRYIDPKPPWLGEVAQAPRLLDDLERRWQGVSETRRRFDENLAAQPPLYGAAANALLDLRQEEASALDPLAGNRFLRSLCTRLGDADECERTLTDREAKEWQEVLVAVADRTETSEARPDLAEDLLRKFRDRASPAIAEEVERKRQEVAAQLATLKANQEAAFKAEEALCLNLLRQRRYMGAYEGAAEAARSGRWVTGVGERYRELGNRMQRMTELHARFLERVPKARKIQVGGEDFAGSQVEPAPGDDKDRFVARSGKRTVEFGLGDLKRKQLEEILAFGPEDRYRQGWFRAAEAYRADTEEGAGLGDEGHGPYEAETLWQEALGLLDRNDPWRPKVSEELTATRKRIQQGEERAQRADAELTAARAAQPPEDVKAFALVNELLDSLAWTKYVRDGKKNAYLLSQRKELERLAGRPLFIREMGVPATQVDYGGTDDPSLPAKETSIRFTGRIWHPDEDKVAKDEPNREARLDQLADEYWADWFRSKGKTPEEIQALLPLAKAQLLMWRGPVETVPEGGYRPAKAALVADPAQWWTDRDRPLDIDLAFPFRPDRDWRIEVEVEWPGEPGYFVLAAGRIQAVVGYQEPRTMGGIAGACLLLGEDLDPGAHGKELADLHWHLVNPEDPKASPSSKDKDKAFLKKDAFVLGVPYRLILRRDDEWIRFEMFPKGQEAKKVQLEKRERSDVLEKNLTLADGRRVFRFFGAPGYGLPYVLRDVKITGILPPRAGQGAARQ